jgi:phosphinothricin acetyltransferase
MKIEKVSTADAEELLAIYAPYVEETAISFEYEVPSVDEFRNRIEQISAKYPYIKAVVDGKIAGYAYAAGFKDRKAYDWSVETTIYIRKDCRQMGLGKALYEKLEKLLKEMGILNMNACIASPAAERGHLTDDSYRFHKKMGFTLVGRFHNSGYKFGEWYDMIWMEKMIGEHKKDMPDVRFGQ